MQGVAVADGKRPQNQGTLAVPKSQSRLERGLPFDRGASFCSLHHPLGALATSPVTHTKKALETKDPSAFLI